MENKQYTLSELKKLLPNKARVITQEAVDIINASINDPEFQGESLLKTALAYEGVLSRSRSSIPEYLNAIRFCAYLHSNDNTTIIDAYKKTFVDREFVRDRWNAKPGTDEYNELTSAASRYRKSKIVVDILTVSQMPLDLMFTGHRYKAIGVLADLMVSAKLDRDKINAAKELLAATKGPDNLKIELDVGVKENSAIDQLNEQLTSIAAKQKTLIEHGVSEVKEFGALKVKEDNVIEGELVE